MGRKRKYGNAEEYASAKRFRERTRYDRRVDLADQKQRWDGLRESSNCDSDRDLACLLLSRYEADLGNDTKSEDNLKMTSVHQDMEETVAYEDFESLGIESDDDGCTEPPDEYLPSNASLIDYTKSQRHNERSYHMENLEIMMPGDVVHPLPPLRPDDIVDVTAFPVIPDTEAALADTPCLSYVSCLLELAPAMTCQKCHKQCSVAAKYVGSAVIFIWSCANDHVSRRWSSQPRFKKQGINLGDFLMAVNILLSGNNYTKIALLCKFMGLGIISDVAFNQVQRLYCVPAIDTFWQQVQADSLKDVVGKDVIVSGDGRNDSPGHSAQYCTYTLMDHDTSHILSMKVVDKRETDCKSVNMEKLGARRAITEVLDAGVIVKEMVTDAHPQMISLLKEYENVIHQLDMWHGSKNLAKKLHAAAEKKENHPLKEWIPDIVNHFWYCCSKADGNVNQFISRWRGVVHHVTGVHAWVDGILGDPRCEHAPMDMPTDGKKWLEAGSPAHKAKDYSYIPQLLQAILEMRATVAGPLAQPARMSASDPRRIASTLAGDDLPSVEELVQRHVSRMQPNSTV